MFKVSKSGCDDHTSKIIKSFLNERTARLKLESFNVERGVPQGTRLGPLLYNIFTADLTKNISIEHNKRIQTYADDTLVS